METEILTKVDAFYQSAWDKLIIVGALALAIVGVLVPLVIQWYQKKSLRLSEEGLKSEMVKRTEALKEELTKHIQAVLDERMKEQEQRFDELLQEVTAKVHHLQGNSELDKDNVQQAYGDFVTAGSAYLDCNDFTNLGIVLSIIGEMCLPRLTIVQLVEQEEVLKSDLTGLLDRVEKQDSNGALLTVVRQLRVARRNKSQTSLRADLVK